MVKICQSTSLEIWRMDTKKGVLVETGKKMKETRKQQNQTYQTWGASRYQSPSCVGPFLPSIVGRLVADSCLRKGACLGNITYNQPIKNTFVGYEISMRKKTPKTSKNMWEAQFFSQVLGVSSLNSGGGEGCRGPGLRKTNAKHNTFLLKSGMYKYFFHWFFRDRKDKPSVWHRLGGWRWALQY